MLMEKKVAKEIISWFETYADYYEFEQSETFADYSLKSLKSVDPEKLWEILAPQVKEIVVGYLTNTVKGMEDEGE